MERSREELLNTLDKIEQILLFRDLADAANAARHMAECKDLYAMQTFLLGLSRKLSNIDRKRIIAWSEAYHAVNDEQPEAETTGDDPDE